MESGGTFFMHNNSWSVDGELSESVDRSIGGQHVVYLRRYVP